MAHERGNGTLLTFVAIVISVVWGLWKHDDGDRVSKAKKHSAAYRQWQSERSKKKKKKA